MNNAPTQARDGDEETVETTTPVPSETPAASQGDASPSRLGRLASQFNAWRETRSADANAAAEQKRLVRLREDQEQRQRQEAASAAAVGKRRKAASLLETKTKDDLAPVPDYMRKIGAWLDRGVGGAQLLAPLVVSGFFTVQTGMDKPLDMGLGIALAFTLGLEGSLWYLNRLREQTRLEGDSTFSLTAAILGIIALIMVLIGGHAIWKATGERPISIDLPLTDASVPLSDIVPAIAVALMSAIGTFVWAKRATFQHRVKLREQNRIDAAPPRFATAGWIFCPRETFCSLRHAVRYRIQSPILAIEDWRLWKLSNKPKVWPPAETLEAELMETPPSRETYRPARALHAVSSGTAIQLTTPSRQVLPSSPETSQETVTVSGEDAPFVSTVSDETVETDRVKTVGRLRDEDGLSYAKIAIRLAISKAQAGRLGQEYDKRLRLRPETGETTVPVAN